MKIHSRSLRVCFNGILIIPTCLSVTRSHQGRSCFWRNGFAHSFPMAVPDLGADLAAVEECPGAAYDEMRVSAPDFNRITRNYSKSRCILISVRAMPNTTAALVLVRTYLAFELLSQLTKRQITYFIGGQNTSTHPRLSPLSFYYYFCFYFFYSV